MKSKFWRRFSRNKGAVFGLIVLMLVALVTALGPFVAQNNPWDMVGTPFAAPMAEQGLLLGTDTMGRDILSGIVTGARVSLLIGVVSTVVSLLIGVSIGAVSGYFGGWIDATLMRFTELFQAIPSFALAIVLVAIFQPSVQSIVTAIAIVSWPPENSCGYLSRSVVRRPTAASVSLARSRCSARLVAANASSGSATMRATVWRGSSEP